MDVIFKGFESPLPAWLLVIFVAGCIALAVWSYWKVSLPNRQKALLITLRAVAFILLLMVLFNPTFQRVGMEVVKHRVAVLMDNSLSSGLELGQYRGDSSYSQARSVLADIDTTEIKLLSFGFDRVLNPTVSDSLALDGRETDIALAIGTVAEIERDARAIVLFTDGQFNAGRDPRFVADRLNQPLFIVGLGDSTRVRDLVLQDVIHPATAYKDTRVPIEIMIANDGFQGSTVEVRLQSGGATLETKTVNLRSERSVQSVPFEILLDTEGLRQFEAVVTPLDGEWTTRNNRFSFSIDVLDNRLRVLLLSFEVHPDVKVIQSVLDGDESVVSRSLTWLNGDRFLGGALPANADTVDLVIVHGFPHGGIPNRVTDQVLALMGQTSYVLAASPLFDPALAMRRLEGSIPLSLPPVNSPFEVGVIVNPTAREHPILNYEHPEYERAPRLFGHIRNLSPSPGAEMLLRASFRGADVQAPLLVVRTVGSRRTAVLNLFGYYVWSLNSSPVLRDAVHDLLRNIVVWTATKPDDRLLAIDPVKRSFDSGDPVMFNAFLKDESGLQVADGVINLDLRRTGDDETQTFTLQNDGLGKYSLDVGALPEGLYEFEAAALRGSREIDRRSGQFSVTESVVEYANTQRNDALLRDLAVSTGGAFVTWEEADQIPGLLAQRPELQEPEQRQVAIDWYPYRNIGWFLLALLLLTAEWLIRRFSAMP